MSIEPDESRERIYTTATRELDEALTTVVADPVGHTSTGRPVRLVEVPESIVGQQRRHYTEALELCLCEQDWRFEVQFGNVLEGDDAGAAGLTPAVAV